uniref:Uncharacterized protein n=1 Tax=Callorhinchus milii TaxID=7868 RepID=A0A4W3IL68_CALMI
MEGEVAVSSGCRRGHPRQKQPRAYRSRGCCAHQKKWRQRKPPPPPQQQQQQQQQQRGRYGRGRSHRPELGALLRPVNLNGKRAPGMRAPKNTTQFLMHEKYQELKRQAAAQCPKHWEGDSMLDYLSYFEYSRGSFERANAESLGQGERGHLSQSASEHYCSSERDLDRTETFLKRNFEDLYNRLEDNSSPRGLTKDSPFESIDS